MPSFRAGAFVVLVLIVLAGCGDEGQNSGGALPQRPADKLIDETGRPERVVKDPTPQAGTGGTIPGYNPTE